MASSFSTSSTVVSESQDPSSTPSPSFSLGTCSSSSLNPSFEISTSTTSSLLIESNSPSDFSTPSFIQSSSSSSSSSASAPSASILGAHPLLDSSKLVSSSWISNSSSAIVPAYAPSFPLLVSSSSPATSSSGTDCGFCNFASVPSPSSSPFSLEIGCAFCKDSTPFASSETNIATSPSSILDSSPQIVSSDSSPSLFSNSSASTSPPFFSSLFSMSAPPSSASSLASFSFGIASAFSGSTSSSAPSTPLFSSYLGPVSPSTASKSAFSFGPSLLSNPSSGPSLFSSSLGSCSTVSLASSLPACPFSEEKDSEHPKRTTEDVLNLRSKKRRMESHSNTVPKIVSDQNETLDAYVFKPTVRDVPISRNTSFLGLKTPEEIQKGKEIATNMVVQGVFLQDRDVARNLSFDTALAEYAFNSRINETIIAGAFADANKLRGECSTKEALIASQDASLNKYASEKITLEKRIKEFVDIVKLKDIKIKDLKNTIGLKDKKIEEFNNVNAEVEKKLVAFETKAKQMFDITETYQAAIQKIKGIGSSELISKKRFN